MLPPVYDYKWRIIEFILVLGKLKLAPSARDYAVSISSISLEEFPVPIEIREEDELR